MSTIAVSLLPDRTTVRIDRDAEVDATTWLQLLSEWGSPNAGGNRFLLVPLDDFLARRQAFAGICRENGITPTLDAEITELLVQLAQNSAALRDRLAEPHDIAPEQAAARLVGTRFARSLRDFQARDLGRLLALPHGANFSVPGAGKTTVTLALYETERTAQRVEQLLVIAPLSAFDAWTTDAVDCFNEPAPVVTRYGEDPITADTEILLVNYQRLDSAYDELARWVSRKSTMVVLDEAHRMKRGWAGTWGTHCLNLAFLAQRRDILTGTPAPQAPRDLVALVDYLWPGEALTLLPSDALVTRPPSDAGVRVGEAIRPLFARTTKRELELPPVEFHPLVMPLEPIHAQIYAALRAEYAGQFRLDEQDQLDFYALGRIVMYLLEAATNPKLLTAGSLSGADPDVFRHPPITPEPGTRLYDLLHNYNEYETPRKFKQLAVLVEENAREGRKTLIWSNFVRNLLTLERQFARYQPALIHGAVPQFGPPGSRNRDLELKRFRHDDDCLVLLANPAAMSEGVSLHKQCHHAIYLDRTFNAGQYLQSLDRIHRLGLPEDVVTHFTFLISEGTIDQTVDQRVRLKATVLGELLNDEDLAAVALPDEEDYGSPIDADEGDLAALFEHLRTPLDGETGDAQEPTDVAVS